MISAGHAYRIFSQYPIYNSDTSGGMTVFEDNDDDENELLLLLLSLLLNNNTLLWRIDTIPFSYPGTLVCCRTLITSDGLRIIQ
jgi:hypothetical protein